MDDCGYVPPHAVIRLLFKLSEWPSHVSYPSIKASILFVLFFWVVHRVRTHQTDTEPRQIVGGSIVRNGACFDIPQRGPLPSTIPTLDLWICGKFAGRWPSHDFTTCLTCSVCTEEFYITFSTQEEQLEIIHSGGRACFW